MRPRPRVYRNETDDYPWTGCFPDGTCDDYRTWPEAFRAVFHETKYGRKLPR